MFVIQRTAPGERTQYWGRMNAWIVEPPKLRFSQIGAPLIPSSAYRYERWDVAQEVAESLRLQNFEHGVVIAVVSDLEPATA